MEDDKILSSEKTGNQLKEKVITTEDGSVNQLPQDIIEPSDIKERIRKSTINNGLSGIPVGFDEQNGDWICIDSLNPFEILYLDYQQSKFITPEIVKNNYSILEKFWKDKVGIMNTGGNRVAFKSKYGEGTIENALQKLKKASEKLSSEQGIENYYTEINNARLRKGEENLKESIEDMLIDGIVDKSEIDLRLERGIKYNLTEEEIIIIIKRAIDKNNLKPYGKVSGNSLRDQLLSVTWMTDKNIEERLKIEEEKKKRGREIFDNVFAYSIEDIGEILFKNEGQAKEYIREGLIINSIDYFSSSKAKQILEITKEKKDEHLKYLQIIYRLNTNLPYRFESKSYSTIKELSIALFENQKTGKEHFKQGNLAVWLKEFQPESYKNVINIQESSKNVDLVYLEFLYTLNRELPYNFSNNNYSNIKELTIALFENPKTGKEHFKKGNLEIWMQICFPENYKKLVKIRDSAENLDLAFLETIYTFNPELPYRFADNQMVKSPIELCTAINNNKENWVAGKNELYNSFILIWLKTIGKKDMVEKWEKVKDQYLLKTDIGLEFFLHLLNEKLDSPQLDINVKAISFPEIQSGKNVTASFILTNKIRGFIEGNLAFTKPLNGVTLSSKYFMLNNAAGLNDYKVDLTIDSEKLLKGFDYKTDIQISTPNDLKTIPVSFKIVFPKNAFIATLLKFVFLFAFFGLILRGIIYAFGFHDWLNTKYNFYLHPFDIAWQGKPTIYYFPVIFLIFIVFIVVIYGLWNPIKRTLNLK